MRKEKEKPWKAPGILIQRKGTKRINCWVKKERDDIITVFTSINWGITRLHECNFNLDSLDKILERHFINSN